jgi:cytochrome c biogenesis protein CcmG/thiol:disulfide interchange protein DsbE
MTDAEADDFAAEVELRDRRRAMWIVGPVAVIVAGLLAVLALSDTRQNQRGGQLQGQVVPPLAGITLDGGRFDIDAQRGRWVVVNFFASWCVPCRSEHPELREFVARHPDGDAVLVGVAVSNTRDDVQAFVDELGGDWPLVVDDTTGIIIDFGVTAPPTTFVVAPSGVVVREFIGEVTADDLDDTIAALTDAAAAGEPK